MKMFMLVLLLACVAASAHAANHPQRNFTVDLPTGWVQVPQSVVEAKEDQLHQMFPSEKRLNWSIAFQRSSNATWFSYPYGGAEVFNSGKVSQSFWKNLENWGAVTSKREQAQAQHKLKRLFTGLKMRDVSYDQGTNIVWGYMDAANSDVGQIVGLVGFIQTNKGYIQAFCYYLRGHDHSAESECRKIISSVSPTGGLIYAP